MHEVTMPNGRVERFDDHQPHDKAMCSKFGSGAFPCGPPFRVHLMTASTVYGPGNVRTSVRRRVLCRGHYESYISNIPGGSGGLKMRAMQSAYEHLAAAHLDEFQQLFQREVAAAVEREMPGVDPAVFLPALKKES